MYNMEKKQIKNIAKEGYSKDLKLKEIKDNLSNEGLCCEDKNICSLECAPEKNTPPEKFKCSCGGSC